jgi:hypothetical protein
MQPGRYWGVAMLEEVLMVAMPAFVLARAKSNCKKIVANEVPDEV